MIDEYEQWLRDEIVSRKVATAQKYEEDSDRYEALAKLDAFQDALLKYVEFKIKEIKELLKEHLA